MLMHKLKPIRCCQAANAATAAACDSTKSSSPSSLVVIPYHTQACLAVWNHVLKCICRLGRMLLYGLQGQQEGDHGEVRGYIGKEGLLVASKGVSIGSREVKGGIDF